MENTGNIDINGFKLRYCIEGKVRMPWSLAVLFIILAASRKISESLCASTSLITKDSQNHPSSGIGTYLPSICFVHRYRSHEKEAFFKQVHYHQSFRPRSAGYRVCEKISLSMFRML